MLRRCRADIAEGFSHDSSTEGKKALNAILIGKIVVCTWTGKRDGERLIANCAADTLGVEAWRQSSSSSAAFGLKLSQEIQLQKGS